MSRIGRTPITLPSGVEISTTPTTVTVKGPKGQLVVPFNPRLKLNREADTLTLLRPSDAPRDRAQHGLTRSLLNNAVQGVTQGYSRNLQIQGVGYRCAMRGPNLELQLGFTHPVVVEPPAGLTIAAPAPPRSAGRALSSTSHTFLTWHAPAAAAAQRLSYDPGLVLRISSCFLSAVCTAGLLQGALPVAC